ncbi:hypothetical protein EXA18_00605 [Vibrio cincinnatiensis]|uniref:hypothetical protein n=1 Tax=Vibrio cincinnatiensis TaxID=675 RepID=UPI001EE10D93|nr:hypothetical protein [Vibrio cincinnatiensis]MCG3741983.1 hypothetical protein [Vibrio cincinnatiensis]
MINNYEIPPSFDLKALPVETQYRLNRLLSGETNSLATNKLKSQRVLRDRKFEQAMEIALSLQIFRLIEEYTELVKGEKSIEL